VSQVVKLTVVYDNETLREDLVADWGFACLVEAHGRTLLFDTGAQGEILLGNMARLGIDPARVDSVVISHSHGDHRGGLEPFLERRQCPVYLPARCPPPRGARAVTHVARPLELSEGLHSTGTLGRVEQALVVSTPGGAVVVVGCSHPGVRAILAAAARVAPPRALLGGLHGFSEFACLEPLELICPLHCTRHKQKIARRFPATAIGGGVGLVLTF
jgi:7,8-dihydropterin-6-yl-methyl-4-(beta-D-ribofuranosyl)aminobenzene 5'-phosphate synthase